MQFGGEPSVLNVYTKKIVRLMAWDRAYYVYILASQRNGTLYTGVTNNLARRMWEHTHDVNPGFTWRYCVHMLVYYECTNDISAALHREKLIKKWKRRWKLELIERHNPYWNNLYLNGEILALPVD